MKMNPAVAAGLSAVVAALALNACAAPDILAGSESGKATRPHSHLQEKTGILPSAPASMPDRPNAANDRSKHFHPRDGK